MKIKFIALISCILLAIISCQQIDLSKDSSDSSDSRANLIVTLSYNQTSSGFANARSVAKALSSVASRVTYVIMQNGKVIQTENQVKGTDSNFGTLEASLDPGDYRLIVFAHNCSDNVSVSDNGIITCPDNKITDSFSYTTEFTITKDDYTALECQLNRCVSLLYIKSDDAIPDEVTGLKLTLTGPSAAYDGVNQKGYVTDPVVKDISEISYVKNSSTGCLELNTYLFLPETESQIDVTLDFVKYDQSTKQNETIVSRTLSGVNLKVNQQNTVNAKMFETSGVNCSITADADWLDPVYQSF